MILEQAYPYTHPQAKKSATAIYSFLLDRWENAKSKINFGPLQGGVLVYLGGVGYSLDFKLRREFAAACKLLHKKNKIVFLLGKNEAIVFHAKPYSLKKEVMKTGSHYGMKKVGGENIVKLFGTFGVHKGGKAAFYTFLNKLTAYNKLHDNKKAVGAIIYKQIVPVTLVSYKMWAMNDEEEEEQQEKKIETHIEIPKTTIKVPKTSLLLKFKEALQPLKIDGSSSSALKSAVAKGIAKDQIFVKAFNNNKTEAEAFANTSIKYWAESAMSKGSRHTQVAVAQIAKLKPNQLSHFMTRVEGDAKYKNGQWSYSSGSYGYSTYKGNEAFYDDNSDSVFKKHLVLAHTIYKKTQTFLKEKGVKELILFRGMHQNKSFKGVRGIRPKKATLKLNPLSSFTSTLVEAEGFGDHIIATVVPVSRIFSCAKTGHGCWGEEEFVVIGGKIKGYIINYEKFVDIIRDKEDNLINKTALIDHKISDLGYALSGGYGHISPKKKAKLLKLKEQLEKKLIENKTKIKKIQSISKKNEPSKFIEKIFKGLLTGQKGVIKEIKQQVANILPPMEPDPEIYADSGDNVDWTKITLDGLPLIGTKEFMQYVAKSGRTMDQVLASRPYRLAHIKFAPVVFWLKRMANTLDPQKAVVKAKPIDQIKPTLCHLAVLRGIAKRMKHADKIWFFGDNDGKHLQVFHSLLTDLRNKVIENNFRGVGSLPTQFDPKQGYKTPAGEYLPVLDKVTVREFLDKFFKS